ncbi:MAG: hypothetical protein AAF958_16160 [Planctomycetota bacterium]
MPISGPVVHQQLMDAYNHHQRQYEADRTQLAGSKGKRDDLDAGRGDVLIDLAEFYLPELTPEAIQNTWAEVRSRLAEVLHRQQQAIDLVAGKLEQLNKRRVSSDERLIELNRSIDEAIETRDAMAEKVQQRLVDDASFRDLSEKAALAETALQRAEANLNEIEQDAARKLPAYERCKLFGYLRDRGFGTPQYTHRGITRRMDRWLAKYIDYRQAKKGFDFLKQTPDQMRQIIAEDRRALDTVMDELERRRDEVAAEVGLDVHVDSVARQVQNRRTLVRELDSLLTDIEAQEAEFSSIRDPRGSYYTEAIEIFRDMLGHIDTRELDQRARRTRDLSDDQIVARLEGLEDQIESLDDAARKWQSDLLNRQKALGDLGRLIQQFRTAGFDSSRSQFVGSLDVFGEVDKVIRRGDMESLWQVIRSSQRWGPTMMEKIGNAARHPATQVLINAMAHAVGGALVERSRGAGSRRRRGNWGGGNWGGGSWGGSWGAWHDSSG